MINLGYLPVAERLLYVPKLVNFLLYAELFSENCYPFGVH